MNVASLRIGADHMPDTMGFYPGAWAEWHPDKAAVVHAATGWEQTYRELDAQANRLASLLRECGLAAGDHVVVLMENHPRFLEIVWGCHYAGLVYTTCSTRLTAEEVSYIVNDSGATAFITSSTCGSVAAQIVSDTPAVEVRLAVGGSVDRHERYELLVDRRDPAPLPEPRFAGVDMIYSSGTTGRPKGVARKHDEQPLQTTPVAGAFAGRRLFGFDDRTVYLCPAPLYHGAGIRFTMACNALGGTAVVMDRFDAETFLALVERYQVTHTQVVPTMMLRFLRLPQEVRDRYDMSSLRYFVHSAAPCPQEVKQRTIEWLGPVVYEYYAGTEGNGVVFCNTEEWLAHPGTVGRPIGCEIHICDENFEELATGEIGVVYFASRHTFEYHGDAVKTAGSRHPRGWSTLGDMGYLDEDGYLYLTDRKSFMIISGGVNVYPQETENVLTLHPQVSDVAVFGLPHEEFGEQVVAVVQPAVPLDSASAEEIYKKRLLEYCREHLADIKCPRIFHLRSELPRDPSGKLLKHQLRSQFLTPTG